MSLLLMVVSLMADGHAFFHEPLSALGVDTHPRRIMRRRGVVSEDPAHVMEQPV